MPLEGVETYVLLLFDSGRSHPDIVTLKVYNSICIQYVIGILYALYCIYYLIVLYRIQPVVVECTGYRVYTST